MAQSNPTGCLLAVFKMFGVAPTSATSDLPYRRQDALLTKAERSFYGVLCEIVKGRHLIFAKVRLADLIMVPKGTPSWQGHFNRVQSKHVDFVICDYAEIRPLLAIELDDSSHQRSQRAARDGFVDSALCAASFPLLRVRARAAYNVADLMGQIDQAMRLASEPTGLKRKR